MNKTGWVALTIVGIIVAIVVVLAGGGDPAVRDTDAGGDVAVGEGDNPPTRSELADIESATVTREESGIVFAVTMAMPAPARDKDVLTLRWDLAVDGQDAWLVSANLANKPVASISSVQGSFGASTIDETLPGDIEVDGATITITIRTDEIDGFQTPFTWKVTATVDGDPSDPASAVATDTAPDSGPGKLE